MDSDNDRYAIDNEIEITVSGTDEKILSDEELIRRSSCVFGDIECGEPFSSQCIVLDFTPVEGLDNDDVQRKCCEFWDFVNSQPELNSLIVRPKVENHTNITKSSDTISITKQTSSASIDDKEKTAVSVLEFVEEKGLISRAFNSKMINPFCDEESKDYFKDNISKTSKARASVKKNANRRKTPKDFPTSTSAQNMCEILNEWDLIHPKSLSPPGPVPDLQDNASKSKPIP